MKTEMVALAEVYALDGCRIRGTRQPWAWAAELTAESQAASFRLSAAQAVRVIIADNMLLLVRYYGHRVTLPAAL